MKDTEQESNDTKTNKFSLRTNTEDASLIRLAYSDYRSRAQIINPDSTAPSMNAFLKDAVISYIERAFK
jgi:hypothetical protein